MTSGLLDFCRRLKSLYKMLDVLHEGTKCLVITMSLHMHEMQYYANDSDVY